MNTYEVFLKRAGKEEFRHAGSVVAPDDEMAPMYAREAYVRRNEGDEMWLVNRNHVIAGDPDFVSANADKTHRSNSGRAVAGHRKAQRAQETQGSMEEGSTEEGSMKEGSTEAESERASDA